MHNAHASAATYSFNQTTTGTSLTRFIITSKS